ncbi:MAG: hypothetical protein ACI9HU_000063, partial [Colwellia sp.]
LFNGRILLHFTGWIKPYNSFFSKEIVILMINSLNKTKVYYLICLNMSQVSNTFTKVPVFNYHKGKL